jgi:hypothetical protein
MNAIPAERRTTLSRLLADRFTLDEDATRTRLQAHLRRELDTIDPDREDVSLLFVRPDTVPEKLNALLADFGPRHALQDDWEVTVLRHDDAVPGCGAYRSDDWVAGSGSILIALENRSRAPKPDQPFRPLLRLCGEATLEHDVAPADAAPGACDDSIGALAEFWLDALRDITTTVNNVIDAVAASH